MTSESPTQTGRVRILRLFSRLNIGGPSWHVIHLSAGLAARGYETRLVVGRETACEGNLLDVARAQGVDYVQINSFGREIRPWNEARAWLAILGLVRRFRPTIVHTHTAKAGLLGRTAARLNKVPVVVHTFHGHVLQGYFGRWQTTLYQRLEAALARHSDCLVAVSESLRDDLLGRGIGEADRMRVIPLGLDLTRLAAALPSGALRGPLGIGSAAPLIGIVGRLAPIKDVSTFLTAAAAVHRRLPAAHFVIVGDGELRPALEAQARQLGLGNVVHFTGWRRDLAAVYGDLDLAVNSSRNEGTPVALIEALAAGRPVVATHVGGTPDLLGDGDRGLLVPPRDPEALASAMLDACSADAQTRERTRRGKAYVLRQHSVERLIGDMDQLYRGLLAAKGLPPAPGISSIT